MKVVLLAGGKGTRLSEESQYRPKPMVEIGEKPLLWHIMQRYSRYRYNDFIICCGYKGHIIKDYFLKYHMQYSDLIINTEKKQVEYLNHNIEPWKVTLVNTGLETLTAGRILKIKEYIGDDEEFMLTYGDGVSDIDIDKLMEFHRCHNKTLTISITKPEGRFGAVSVDDVTKEILGFKEKARSDQSFINIGFMVCKRNIFDFLGDGSEMLENGPFERIVAAKEMVAYEHSGFWSPMDNIKDKEYLTELYNSESIPWMK